MSKIDEKKLQKKIAWSPHENQQKILDCQSREKIICAGRRFGKSALCAYEILLEALQPNKRIWITAPSYELSNIVFDQVLMFLSKAISNEYFKVKRKPFPVLKMDNGTIIEGKSCEAKSGMLGRSTDLVVIDEAALVDENIWNQYIKPTTHERKGRVFYISTPRGLNWFYTKFLALQKNGSAFRFSSIDNPYFPFPNATEKERNKEWEKIKSSVPEKVFRQEYMAEFLTEAGLVFRGIEEVISEDCTSEPQKDASYVLGVDIARHEDYTALTVVDRRTKNVVYIDRFRGMDYPQQKDRILTCAKRYNNAKIIVDSTGIGDSLTSDLKRFAYVEDYPLYSNKAKLKLIDKLIIFIDQGVIRIPRNEDLINELKIYEVKVSEKSGIYQYSAPRGRHDDMVISLALAVWGLMPNKIKDEDEDDEFATPYTQPLTQYE